MGKGNRESRWWCRLVALLFGLVGSVAAVAEVIDVELTSGMVITTERFGSGPTRLLWLPSEYGSVDKETRALVRTVAGEGVEVWLVDLHGSYFLAPGRTSLEQVPLEEMRELITIAQPKQGQLFLFSYGRGAALALQAARQWQLAAGESRQPLGGALLFHPNLMAGTAKAGEPPRFSPIASATNLPIFIFQPMNSAKRWYLQALAAELSRGGSDVYYRPLVGVSDGYQVREDANAYEREARKAIPKMVRSALRLLQPYNREARNPLAKLPQGDGGMAPVTAGLQPVAGRPQAPTLSLYDIEGQPWALGDLRGEVVLLNFWATWCPPCVEEIPSLGRLNLMLEGEPFRLISVDVGEEAVQVQQFLENVPADFPVLLDPQGSTTEPWKLRAFPTSFLIDRQGRLRYGYFGGLKWDAPEVLQRINTLLQE